jgi:hypothetical protein
MPNANQHSPKKEYYTSTLSFNRNSIPQGRLLNGAGALKESLRDAVSLLNVYVKDGKIKKSLEGNSFKLSSADKGDLDKILPDLRAALSVIEDSHDLKGLFSLSGGFSEKYDVFNSEFFGESKKLKELSEMIKTLGGRITADGRIQKIELPQGAVNPVTKASAIKSVRSTFGNAQTNIKKFLTSKGINWDEYRTGADIARKALMNQAVQIERNAVIARPDIAERLYMSKERIARANADATSQRIDQIIAGNEEPVLPATTSAKLRPQDKVRWAAYKKHWEMQAITPEMVEAGVFDRLNKNELDRKAVENYIQANPNTLFAREELAKRQRITNREDRAKLFEAEQTPGTPEFEAKIKRRLDKHAANDDIATKWAKLNRGHPVAKAILKNRRNRTAGGRVLNKALSAARFGAIGAILSVITTAVGMMVKFLSGLPALAENVRKMANRGAVLGVTDGKLRQLESLEGRLGGLDKGAVGEYLYAMHSKIADVATSEGMVEVIDKLSPLLSRSETGSTLISKIAHYSVGQNTDTNGLGNDLLNAILMISMQGKTLYGDTYNASDALRFNAITFGRGLGAEEIINSFAAALQNPALIPATVREQIRNVANGRNETINGENITGGKVLDAIIAAIEGKKDTLKPRDTATVVEWKAADEVAAQWRNLAETFREMKIGVLVTIASTLSGILSFVETIAKGFLMSLPGGLKERFAPIVQGMDERAYFRNKNSLSDLETVITFIEQSALTFADANGLVRVQKDYTDAAGVRHSFQSREHQLRMGILGLEKSFYGGQEGIPREFVGKEKEFQTLMEMIRFWRLNENKLAETKAVVEGYENMGATITYQIRDKDSKIVNKDYKYEVGNMPSVSNTSSSTQLSVQAKNDLLAAMTSSDRLIDSMASNDNWWDRAVNDVRDWHMGELEKILEKDGTLSSADRNSLEKYRNAKARLDNYASDGLAIDALRPEGQPDTYIKGEAAVITGRNARTTEENLAQISKAIIEIRAQAGEGAFHGVIENNITVSGIIKAEDRTYTIELIDKATGRSLGTVRDVQNMSSNLDMTNIYESFEALRPTR